MILESRDAVITLWGVLTQNEWASLKPVLAQRLAEHPDGVVIDLGGVGQMTPEGAATFADARAFAGNAAKIALAGATAHLGKTLGASATESVAQAQVRFATNVNHPGERFQAGRGKSGALVVALFGADTDEHAVAVACRLAGSVPSDTATGEPVVQMHLLRMWGVARDRALTPPTGDSVYDGAALRLQQFAVAVQKNGCAASVATQIERTRDAGTRLVELAGDLEASFLVLAFGANASADDVDLARYVVEHAPCEVIVNRVPGTLIRADGGGTETTGKEVKP